MRAQKQSADTYGAAGCLAAGAGGAGRGEDLQMPCAVGLLDGLHVSLTHKESLWCGSMRQLEAEPPHPDVSTVCTVTGAAAHHVTSRIVPALLLWAKRQRVLQGLLGSPSTAKQIATPLELA